jgi:hypothetical protein
MRYTTIGSDAPSARKVSVLSLGTMRFGTTTDEATSFAILDRYVAAGGNFIDRGSCWTRRTEIAVWRLARLDRVRVVPDLDVDRVQVSQHRVELGAYPLAVGPQQRQALVLVAVACSHQLGVATHLADRHARRPQLGYQLDPAQIVFRVEAMTRIGPADHEHQPVALVVAQCVPRQAGALEVKCAYFGCR